MRPLVAHYGRWRRRNRANPLDLGTATLTGSGSLTATLTRATLIGASLSGPGSLSGSLSKLTPFAWSTVTGSGSISATLDARTPATIFGSAIKVNIDAYGGTHLRDGNGFVPTNGVAVEQALDQSGNGYNATKEASVAAPTFNSSAFGGRGSLVNGSACMLRYMSNIGFSGNQTHTIVWVASCASATGTGGWGCIGANASSTSTTSHWAGWANQWAVGSAGEGAHASAGATSTTPYVHVKTWDGSNMAHYKNGTLDNSYSRASIGLTDGYVLMRHAFAGTQLYTVDQAQVLIINGVATSGQIADITAYMRSKWGF